MILDPEYDLGIAQAVAAAFTFVGSCMFLTPDSRTVSSPSSTAVGTWIRSSNLFGICSSSSAAQRVLYATRNPFPAPGVLHPYLPLLRLYWQRNPEQFPTLQEYTGADRRYPDPTFVTKEEYSSAVPGDPEAEGRAGLVDRASLLS